MSIENPFRNPHSHHLSGPRTVAEVERARSIMREERPKRLEDAVATTVDVAKYFEKIKRTDLCNSPFQCDHWKVEPVLIEALEDALSRQEGNDFSEVNRFRDLIRASTQSPVDERTNAELLNHVPADERLHDEMWHEIEETLGSTVVGEALESLVRRVEHTYRALMTRRELAEDAKIRSTIEADIKALQPVRDRLYMRRVHPNFSRVVMQNRPGSR